MQWITAVAPGCSAVVVAPVVRAQALIDASQPTSARLAQLGPEIKVEGWTLRPPIGWEQRVQRESTESRYAWGKNGVGALVLVRPATQPLKRTPDDAMESALEALRARTKGLKPGKIERGLVGN